MSLGSQGSEGIKRRGIERFAKAFCMFVAPRAITRSLDLSSFFWWRGAPEWWNMVKLNKRRSIDKFRMCIHRFDALKSRWITLSATQQRKWICELTEFYCKASTSNFKTSLQQLACHFMLGGAVFKSQLIKFHSELRQIVAPLDYFQNVLYGFVWLCIVAGPHLHLWRK